MSVINDLPISSQQDKGAVPLDEFIAHRREDDHKIQSVKTHLLEVSQLCGRFSAKVSVAEAGKILGLLHDLGKYSRAFQSYIQSATGVLDPDLDEAHVDASSLKGKIDHSTAGAQRIWSLLKSYGVPGQMAGRILSVCLASHHGGLMDCLTPDGRDGFGDRMNKADDKTHHRECVRKADQVILSALENLNPENFIKEFCKVLVHIYAPEKEEKRQIKEFRIGLFTRFLFSCLIDADRINSADFEIPENAKYRSDTPINWQVAISRLEAKLAGFGIHTPIDEIRCSISERCRRQADKPRGSILSQCPREGGKPFPACGLPCTTPINTSLSILFISFPIPLLLSKTPG